MSSTSLMRYDDPAGFRPLREQIAAHVATSRGIHCTADQVVIVAGSQQGLEFASRLLLDPGETAWLEDPCYLGAKAALTSAGARIAPVPVDRDGLDVNTGNELEPDARLAIVTPSHQFPLGVTMTLERRLALIEWAERSNSWIVEDDYDSEFRYRGHPLAALKAIDPYHRVIYVGTFSKTMFPGLRLGYVIAPKDLTDAFAAAHLSTDVHPQLLDQAVMADFLAEGHYARHVRRMRSLYGQRLRTLITEVERELDVLCTDTPDGGLHLVAWLPDHLSDSVVSERALSAGIHAWPLSLHVLHKSRPPALLLGYAGTPVDEIPDAVDDSSCRPRTTPVPSSRRRSLSPKRTRRTPPVKRS
ncbi:PLP-dependent aminotransferase family protein, partial [Streptomyces sp. NPDC000405]|uniref:aminotransferase-like domain-containing protein n=1 Tax=Streptomyces sp. NPDC000405 TaxID=3161033 RepID=UPI00398D0360